MSLRESFHELVAGLYQRLWIKAHKYGSQRRPGGYRHLLGADKAMESLGLGLSQHSEAWSLCDMVIHKE